MLQKLWFINVTVFISIIAIGLLPVMMLNSGVVNHILTPVAQYWSLFQILWQDNPLGALSFLMTKSLLAFSHQNPRSGLNSWTYEIDSISLGVYIVITLSYSWIIRQFILNQEDKSIKRNLLIGGIGCLIITFTFSYMSVAEHCAGATWVGFVTLYGLGFNGFDLTPIYQWVCGILGTLTLAFAVNSTRTTTRKVLSK